MSLVYVISFRGSFKRNSKYGSRVHAACSRFRFPQISDHLYDDQAEARRGRVRRRDESSLHVRTSKTPTVYRSSSYTHTTASYTMYASGPCWNGDDPAAILPLFGAGEEVMIVDGMFVLACTCLFVLDCACVICLCLTLFVSLLCLF